MKRAPLLALAFVLLLPACKHGGAGDSKLIDGVQTFADLKHTHVKTPVTYPQTPPVGGPHNPVWLRCAVYTAPVPNENAVHSMEHGAVWITYQPSLPAADLDVVHRLQALNPAYVLISPYPGLPSPVVASGWGLQLQVQKADDARLAAFVKAYAGGNQGGEGGAQCVNGATPEQIQQLKSSATPSATPSFM